MRDTTLTPNLSYFVGKRHGIVLKKSAPCGCKLIFGGSCDSYLIQNASLTHSTHCVGVMCKLLMSLLLICFISLMLPFGFFVLKLWDLFVKLSEVYRESPTNHLLITYSCLDIVPIFIRYSLLIPCLSLAESPILYTRFIRDLFAGVSRVYRGSVVGH